MLNLFLIMSKLFNGKNITGLSYLCIHNFLIYVVIKLIIYFTTVVI